jgi:Uma2 family endonuclease
MTLADIDILHQRAVKLDGQPIPGLRMTEAEFENWCDEDVRAEWVNGEVILIAPANIDHVGLNFWLWSVVGDFVESRKLGLVLGIEAQVRFPRQKRRRNPDLLFIASRNTNRIRETYIEGPPDLIMEIVSPDSESRDWREKFLDYEAAGVREYWIIDRPSRRVEVYTLDRTKKYRRIQEKNDRIASKVLRGFYIRPKWLWQAPLPSKAAVLREFGV